MDTNELMKEALAYHAEGGPGKIEIRPTKPDATQYDLSLAYSPGVAAPCLAIADDPAKAYDYTIKGNLVAVITNGTAVLGLGDIGPLAAKPVMEGKCMLFKHFSGINAFDIEIDTIDPEEFIAAVKRIAPTFGGINLEDIKAPECFEIERRLVEELDIPVMHDDQHGTAIIASAALINAMHLSGKRIDEAQIVVNGAGAAAIACARMFLALGARRDQITMCDSRGVVTTRRTDLNSVKREFATDRPVTTLREALVGADVFLGVSTAGVLDADMVRSMAGNPLVMALANPDPEISYDEAKAARPDVIVATGRTDYPNQVNNVLGFPYIFRGALDVRARKINETMKLAAAHALAELAREEVPAELAAAFGVDRLEFGPDYLIPTPFDTRLILRIAPAVAQAAAESGVATRPIADIAAYRESLSRFVYQTSMIMRPVFAAAKASLQRVAYAEGEDERVLRAVQVAVEEGLAKPILIGRPAVIEARIAKAGLRLQAGVNYEVCNPEDDPRFRQYWEAYHRLMGRKGITTEGAKAAVRRSNTIIAALMVHLGDADAMLAGLVGRFDRHLAHIEEVFGVQPGVDRMATVNAVMLEDRTLFIADTYINEDPSAEELAQIAKLAADEVARFGLPPKVAFLSHSNYGSSTRKSALKMREARNLFAAANPVIECDGEMHGDAALDEKVRERTVFDSTLHGEANILICPNLDAANILFNVLKTTSGHGTTIGPMLMGANASAHVLTPSATVRRVVNMTALAAAQAIARKA